MTIYLIDMGRWLPAEEHQVLVASIDTIEEFLDYAVIHTSFPKDELRGAVIEVPADFVFRFPDGVQLTAAALTEGVQPKSFVAARDALTNLDDLFVAAEPASHVEWRTLNIDRRDVK